MRYGMFIGLISTLLVAGCNQQQGTVYRQPIEDARRILIATELSPAAFGALSYPVKARSDGASDIVWIVNRGSAEAFRFVASLRDAGKGATRVRVGIKGVTSGPLGNVEQRLAEHATIKKYLLTAMEEQVAAALERRSFNMARVYPAMGVATVANFGAIMAQFDRASEQHKRQSRANIEKAYRDEAAGKRY